MFVGRDRELHDLRRLLKGQSASFVTCRGRRRIGKSTLIREFGKEAALFLQFEGLPPRPGLSNADQLAAFSQQLSVQTKLPKVTLESWPQAFQLLAGILKDEWTVILLDEISWMGSSDPDFAGHLKAAWDNWFKPHRKLVLVVCGSVSAWIEQTILRNTGFVGRTSWDIVLEELPLAACDAFWGKARARIHAEEKLTVLAVTGGVPRYLEEIDSRETAEQSIHRLCFRQEGILFREFDQIFSDVFGRRAQAYREILRALVRGSRTLSEISEELGKERSGHMTDYLHDLVVGGFVAKDPVFNPANDQQARTEKYRLRDNYSRFFLKYVEPRRARIERGLLQSFSLEQLPEWNAILGLQFENLILNHVSELLRVLDLERTPVLSATPYVQRPTARRPGCQIDLLITTRHSLHVVEIKHRKRIGTSVLREVRDKVDRIPAGARRSVRTALVYEGELEDAVSKEGYFDHIIPFSRLLGESGASD